MANLFTKILSTIIPNNGRGSGRTRNLQIAAGGSKTIYSRMLDLEIPEQITRETPDRRNRKVVEICEYCPPAVKALRVIVDDCFSNQDGSDYTLKISETLDDDETPVNAEIKKIGDELLHRLNIEDLKLVAKRSVGLGDAFIEIIPIRENGRYTIGSISVLPTFQMFRIEDDHGELLKFEQRRALYDSQETITFSPAQIVHVRHDRFSIYGRSLFFPCVEDWDNYKLANLSLQESLKTANNPLVYTLPEYWDQKQVDAFRDKKIAEIEDGVQSILFITAEMELNRLATQNLDQRGLIEPIKEYRRMIQDASRLPAWYWTGEQQTGGAKDISGQPALSHIRFITSIRQIVSNGLRQIIDTELVFRGVLDPLQRQYEIEWPRLQSNTNDANALNNQMDESNAKPQKGSETEGQK